MKMTTLRAGVLLPLLTGLAACSSEPGEFTETDPGVASDPFSTAPGEPNHEAITAAGLSFLRPEIVKALQAADVATDVEFVLVNANHFDDCNFTGGSAVVAESQAQAVTALNPSAVSPESDAAAIAFFARSLH